MAITTQKEQIFGVGESAIVDWQNTGLLKPSTFKPAISTIEKVLVLRKLGKLSPSDNTALNDALENL